MVEIGCRSVCSRRGRAIAGTDPGPRLAPKTTAPPPQAGPCADQPQGGELGAGHDSLVVACFLPTIATGPSHYLPLPGDWADALLFRHPFSPSHVHASTFLPPAATTYSSSQASSDSTRDPPGPSPRRQQCCWSPSLVLLGSQSSLDCSIPASAAPPVPRPREHSTASSTLGSKT